MHRKPDGGYTEDVEEGVNAWKALAAPIEEATGWKLYAFDPDLCFQETSKRPWQHQSISVQFATALVKALTNEEIETEELLNLLAQAKKICYEQKIIHSGTPEWFKFDRAWVMLIDIILILADIEED